MRRSLDLTNFILQLLVAWHRMHQQQQAFGDQPSDALSPHRLFMREDKDSDRFLYQEATSNKCIATSNKGIATSNKKLLVTSS